MKICGREVPEVSFPFIDRLFSRILILFSFQSHGFSFYSHGFSFLFDMLGVVWYL